VVEGAGKPDGIPGGVEAASRAAFDLAIAHHLLCLSMIIRKRG